MKRYTHQLEPVYAMSTINPRLQKGWAMDAVIYDTNEGSIPHIHVYHDAGHDKCAYVRLDKAEYSLYHDQNNKNNTPLSKKQLIQLTQLLSSPWPKYLIQLKYGTVRPMTGYEYCVETWIDAFGDKFIDSFQYDDNGVLVMPDYMTLNNA